MKFMKNRTTVGVLCIVVSLIICFGVTPLFNKSISQKTEIVRVTKDINAGTKITKGMVNIVEVGNYNLPENVIKTRESVIGNFATADLKEGDYILDTKLSKSSAYENSYLYSLNGEKQAISLTLKTFASGLSGKLQSGDIVSVIAPDYMGQGMTIIPPELKYVEVISVTASSGYDIDTGDLQNEDERELPSTVTLLVNHEQGNILAQLEAEGKSHLALVFRGNKEKAEKFINAQEKAINEIYHPEAVNYISDSGNGLLDSGERKAE